MYVDGALQLSVNNTPFTSSTARVYMGLANDGSSWGFNGALDQVNIYNTSITSAQVQLDMVNFVPEPTSLGLAALGLGLARRRHRTSPDA